VNLTLPRDARQEQRSSPPLPAGNGSVPLLKRQDEVAIAKRMERGHLMVLKSISRSPIVLKELINVGEELRNGTLSIKKIIQFDQKS